jgi:maltooligosyltrehalose trehalohydrolase
MSWQKKPRGTPALDLPAESFIVFLQNHDQVANSIAGQRLHALTSPAAGAR